MTKTVSYAKAREIFREHNGLLRTAQAIKLGIPPATLYAMRNAGVITQESRGLYRLAEAGLVSNPDLVYVCQRVPKAVVCLISALDFHDLTTQVPHWVTIALPRGARKPTLDFPPVRAVHMSNPRIWLVSKSTKAMDCRYASTALRRRWPTASNSVEQ